MITTIRNKKSGRALSLKKNSLLLIAFLVPLLKISAQNKSRLPNELPASQQPVQGGNTMAPFQVPGIYETTRDYRYDKRTKNSPRTVSDGTSITSNDALDLDLNSKADKEPDLKKRLALNKAAIQNKGTAYNYFRFGNTLYQLLNYDEAVIAYTKADELKPNDRNILVQLANAQVMAGNPLEAEKAFDNLLKIDPKADMELQLVWVKHLLKNKAGAMTIAKQYAAKETANIEPYLIQAALLQNTPEADALLDTAASLNKAIKREDVAPMLVSYANWLQKIGDIEASIVFLDLAVAASPRNNEYLRIRSATNKKLGRLKQAKRDEDVLRRW